jgi:hypothetical protein
VPRFYFDVLESNSLTRDEEGFQFGSLNIAEAEAIRAASEIGHNSLPKLRSSAIGVQVRDEHGEAVLSVTVSMTVRRKALVPA